MRAFDFDALARTQCVLLHLLEQATAPYTAHLHPADGRQGFTLTLTPALERQKHGGACFLLFGLIGHKIHLTRSGVKEEITVL